MTVGDGATPAHLHVMGGGGVMAGYFEKEFSGILRHRGPVDWLISVSQLFQDLVRITESRDLRCCQPLSGMWNWFSMGLFHQHVGVS